MIFSQKELKWKILLASLFVALLLQGIASPARAKDFLHAVKFPKRKNSIVINGSLVRGDFDNYILAASKDQSMTVTIQSQGDNAVFQISALNGEPFLPGAEEGADTRKWSGKLPFKGKYTITVGGVRGNVSYALYIDIH